MAEREITNNKELIPLEHYLAAYREADPGRMAQRTGTRLLPGEGEKDAWIGMVYLGRPYRISWPAFRIESTGEKEAWSPLLETNQSRILVLRYLLEGRSLKGTGRFLTYREVPWGEVYIRQFTGRCITRLAFTYGNRTEDYRRRMERLGGVRIGESDAGYEVEIFPEYKVRFLLWAGDDEFPPSAQILFSDNFAAAFHAEDLVVAAEAVIGALKHM